MPTIKQAVAKNQARIAATPNPVAETGPEAPVSTALVVPPSPALDMPVMMPQRGMFPANSVLASDRSDSSRAFRGAGSRSSTFPFPPSQPLSSKVTVNVSTPAAPSPTPAPVTLSTPTASSLLLQTNSAPNALQTILNLLNGIGISLVPNGSGGVVINGVVFGPAGSSHAPGLVPDPGATALPGYFLRADGTWQVPPGTGGAGEYQTVQLAGTPLPQQPITNLLGVITAANDSGNTSTDYNIQIPSVQTTTILAASVIFASATIIGSVMVPIPATGGPYRIRANYSLYLNSTFAVNGAEAWVAAGANVWAFAGYVQASGQNGAYIGFTPCDISPVTYAAGSGMVQVNLYAQGTHSSSSWTVQSSSINGQPCFKLAAVAEPIT